LDRRFQKRKWEEKDFVRDIVQRKTSRKLYIQKIEWRGNPYHPIF
jgi:hypothetical protein